jgi:hypothetical protein
MDVPEKTAFLPPEEPVIDRGSYGFRFLVGKPDARTLRMAEFLEQAPLVGSIPMRPGAAAPPAARR